MNNIVPFTPDKSQHVITTEQLAKEYGVAVQHIINNFNRHKGRFHEGRDYHFVEGEQLKMLKKSLSPDNAATVDETASQFGKRSPKIYLWTKHGAFVHASLIDNDKVWEVYEQRYVNQSTAQIPEQTQAQIEALQTQNNKFREIITDLLTVPHAENLIGQAEIQDLDDRLDWLDTTIRDWQKTADKKTVAQLKQMLTVINTNLTEIKKLIESSRIDVKALDKQFGEQVTKIDQLQAHIQAEYKLLPGPN